MGIGTHDESTNRVTSRLLGAGMMATMMALGLVVVVVMVSLFVGASFDEVVVEPAGVGSDDAGQTSPAGG